MNPYAAFGIVVAPDAADARPVPLIHHLYQQVGSLAQHRREPRLQIPYATNVAEAIPPKHANGNLGRHEFRIAPVKSAAIDQEPRRTALQQRVSKGEHTLDKPLSLKLRYLHL